MGDSWGKRGSTSLADGADLTGVAQKIRRARMIVALDSVVSTPPTQSQCGTPASGQGASTRQRRRPFSPNRLLRPSGGSD